MNKREMEFLFVIYAIVKDLNRFVEGPKGMTSVNTSNPYHDVGKPYKSKV